MQSDNASQLGPPAQLGAQQNLEQNVQVVQQLYSHFGQGDVDGIIALLDEDIDWLFAGPEDIPFCGHYVGHDAVRHFFDRSLAAAEFLEFTPTAFVPSRDIVLVQGHEHMRVRANGRQWRTDWAHIFTLRDGKIIKLREYYDTAVIVAAFRGEASR